MEIHLARATRWLAICVTGYLTQCAAADLVTDWNATLRHVIKIDGEHAINSANPGWSTRSIAMLNGAIYDAFQAHTRTHQPFLKDITLPAGASLDAAVHQAAYEVLSHTYPGEAADIQATYDARMGLIQDGLAKTGGISVGSQIAQAYIAARMNDHSSEGQTYTEKAGPGKWRSDPFHPGQVAWGPQWNSVTPWAIPDTATYVSTLPPLPALNSPDYTAAFDQVKKYGAIDSAFRSEAQEEMGLFWAYDRATMGPPPVLFLKNLEDISLQAGNTAEENARLFALAGVAMADAATTAWDAKFTYDFWRPVTAIHEAGNDGSGFDDTNPDTVGDATWRPLGAPGSNPNDFTDDFTPPFPAWISGHATMGGAVFKALELFYGTNLFDEIDGIVGNNPEFTLNSDEFDAVGGAGMQRTYVRFTQDEALAGGILDIGNENSPEGENGTSRIYLGIHWIFDQRDGIFVGNQIAQDIAAAYFLAIPEPGSACLGGICLIALAGARGWRE